MHISQLVIGTIFIIGGVILTVVAFFASLFILIYGLPILIIGLFILLNRKEDVVEPIKKRGGKKK